MQLDAEDRPAFMEEYGIKELARDRVIHTCFGALGLICFLTTGEDEVRAWPIRSGLTAPEAAGCVRQEPKTYVVKDGDILNIKFNV